METIQSPASSLPAGKPNASARAASDGHANKVRHPHTGTDDPRVVSLFGVPPIPGEHLIMGEHVEEQDDLWLLPTLLGVAVLVIGVVFYVATAVLS